MKPIRNLHERVMKPTGDRAEIEMTKRGWKTKIKKACENAETYRPCFDSAIDTLADILEKRDGAQQEFRDTGSNMTVEHCTANGVNIIQNPLLKMINEYNKEALSYWRDLGLTAAGLKRINEEALKPKTKKKGFADVLSGLGL